MESPDKGLAFTMAARAVTGVLLSRGLQHVTGKEVEWFEDGQADIRRSALRLTAARYGLPWPETVDQLTKDDHEVIGHAAFIAVRTKADVNDVLPEFQRDIVRMIERFRPLIDEITAHLHIGREYGAGEILQLIAAFFARSENPWFFEIFDTYYRGWPVLDFRERWIIVELTDATIYRNDGKCLGDVGTISFRLEDVTGFDPPSNLKR